MAAILGESGDRELGLPLLPPDQPIVSVHEAPVGDDGSFLVLEDFQDQANIEAKFTLDYILSKRRPIIRFSRNRNLEQEPGLPPREAWLVDLKTYRIPTPIDDRGSVDYDAVIAEVNATIDPSYQWPTQLSLDHFYWPAPLYDGDPIAMRFRQLTVHKGIVPREWENVKHEITIPPTLPSREVMEYRNEAWAVARSLFKSIVETERWRRRARHREQEFNDANSPLRLANPEIQDDDVDIVGKRFMGQILTKHFATVEEKLKELGRIPEEFRLVEPDDTHDLLTEYLIRSVGSEALYLVPKVAA